MHPWSPHAGRLGPARDLPPGLTEFPSDVWWFFGSSDLSGWWLYTHPSEKYDGVRQLG